MRSLTVVTAVGAGLVAGVFFAFSTFVMRALRGPAAARRAARHAVGQPGRSVTAVHGRPARYRGRLHRARHLVARRRSTSPAVVPGRRVRGVPRRDRRDDRLPHPPQRRPGRRRCRRCRGGQPLDRLRRRRGRRGTTSARSRARPPRPSSSSARAAPDVGRRVGRGESARRERSHAACVARRTSMGVSAGDGCCAGRPPARAAVGPGRRGRGPRRSPPRSR